MLYYIMRNPVRLKHCKMVLQGLTSDDTFILENDDVT